ncbi:DUF4244 domain-containing protein [Nocardioides sp. TF02-7]|uniref:DUF4244 domain-containing protein n=1 Tax=Nocardioides sp. TF02-7 TaxID=2917724 RepID=UPI001F06D2AC|nr:DUF4244 domain-containing protein [Nocardioides sp. TF02-7]UMG93299.1 DUF4244 domain-containing protein [Nocardioides sp. TF02-7]
MMTPELQYAVILLRGHLARAKDDERGVSAVEWVIITVAVAAIALALVAVIRSAVEDKSSQINLNE